jgi:hypothetical protein
LSPSRERARSEGSRERPDQKNRKIENRRCRGHATLFVIWPLNAPSVPLQGSPSRSFEASAFLFLSSQPSLLSIPATPSNSRPIRTHPRVLEQSVARASPTERGNKTPLVKLLKVCRSRSSTKLAPFPPDSSTLRCSPKTSPKTAPSVLYRSAGRGARPASGGRPSVSLEKRKTYFEQENNFSSGESRAAATLRINDAGRSPTPPLEYLSRTRSARALNLRS